MIMKLVMHGNSRALVLPKPILEAMGANADTQFQLTVNGNSLTISPANAGHRSERTAETFAK